MTVLVPRYLEMFEMVSAVNDPKTPPAELLDTPALAAALDCGVRHVWKMDLTGRLPKPIRLGRLKKWRRSEIMAWLAAGAPSRKVWEAAKPDLTEKFQ